MHFRTIIVVILVVEYLTIDTIEMHSKLFLKWNKNRRLIFEYLIRNNFLKPFSKFYYWIKVFPNWEWFA